MSSEPLPLPPDFPTQIHVVTAPAADLLPEHPWVLLGDEAVRGTWRAAGLPEPEGSHWVKVDESTKRLETLSPWLETWAALPLHRDATVLAVGGGILTDMAGLASALFLRGVAWHCWPTTLLSQVDAGLGGKTAVNLGAGKNLAGAFHPPARMVVCDAFLDTLPDRQIASGRWEVVKMALMNGDVAWTLALLETPRPAREAMARALLMKADVVHRDLHELNERRLLNLGHTLGHALEVASHHTLLHGEAVGLGCLAACFLAEEQGFRPFPAMLREAMVRELRHLRNRIAPWDVCLPVLARDKKAHVDAGTGASAIHCILPEPGGPAHQQRLPPEAWASAHGRLLAALS